MHTQTDIKHAAQHSADAFGMFSFKEGHGCLVSYLDTVWPTGVQPSI